MFTFDLRNIRYACFCFCASLPRILHVKNNSRRPIRTVAFPPKVLLMSSYLDFRDNDKDAVMRVYTLFSKSALTNEETSCVQCRVLAKMHLLVNQMRTTKIIGYVCWEILGLRNLHNYSCATIDLPAIQSFYI